jgi:hypothetical protein
MPVLKTLLLLLSSHLDTITPPPFLKPPLPRASFVPSPRRTSHPSAGEFLPCSPASTGPPRLLTVNRESKFGCCSFFSLWFLSNSTRFCPPKVSRRRQQPPSPRASSTSGPPLSGPPREPEPPLALLSSFQLISNLVLGHCRGKWGGRLGRTVIPSTSSWCVVPPSGSLQVVGPPPFVFLILFPRRYCSSV